MAIFNVGIYRGIFESLFIKEKQIVTLYIFYRNKILNTIAKGKLRYVCIQGMPYSIIKCLLIVQTETIKIQ
jgi:hypothetical protein